MALALSMLILLAWTALMPKPIPPAVNPAEPVKMTQEAPVLTTPPPELSVKSPESTFSVERDNRIIRIIDPQAAVSEVEFKAYQAYKYHLRYGLLYNNVPPLVFKQIRQSDDQLVFSASDQTKQITKTIIFHNNSYVIDLQIEIKNITPSSLSTRIPLTLGVLNFTGDPNKTRYEDLTASVDEKVIHPNPRKNNRIDNIRFFAMRDRYFCAIIEPADKNYLGVVEKISPNESEIGIISPEIVLGSGQVVAQKFRIYMGPQDLSIINAAAPAWASVLYYGTFDIISQVLLQVVAFLHAVVKNWGVAIILLSILIYLVLYPLSIKQMRSMKEMQALQPKIEALRKQNKDNPQKLNKEIMELYKEHKVNPLGGCLPMVLQIPIFFALYQALIRSIALKGAAFLWVKDLSEPDRLMILPFAMPFLGNELNLLPILMVIVMFLQQKLTSTASSGMSSEQQKIMLFMMPVIFLVIFYKMPAGLVLYWFVNSTLMFLFQLKINRAK